MKARDNPFRVARVLSAIRYEIPATEAGTGIGTGTGIGAGTAIDDDEFRGGAVSLLPRLEGLRYRAAIVGPHGSGKTTLLEDLEGVLPARGFRIVHVRLDTDEPRLPGEWRWRSPAHRLDARVIFCLDGAEQLGAIAWRRFRWKTRRAGGLIVTTHRHGRLPTLIECTTSAGLLQRIMRSLAPDVLGAAPTAAELFIRHHGNIREALRELYDVYANAAPPRPGQGAGTGPRVVSR